MLMENIIMMLLIHHLFRVRVQKSRSQFFLYSSNIDK